MRFKWTTPVGESLDDELDDGNIAPFRLCSERENTATTGAHASRVCCHSANHRTNQLAGHTAAPVLILASQLDH